MLTAPRRRYGGDAESQGKGNYLFGLGRNPGPILISLIPQEKSHGKRIFLKYSCTAKKPCLVVKGLIHREATVKDSAWRFRACLHVW